MSFSLRETRTRWSLSVTLDRRLQTWAETASQKSRLVRAEPLSRHSSLRIGGPASYWIEVGDSEDLEGLLSALGPQRFWCVGLGSNTLFPDEGIEEPVIRLVGDLAGWKVTLDGDSDVASVEVMAGAINAHLVRGLLAEGWVGAEFLTLIPGTFGGAVALNAGTKEQELATILESVTLAIPDEARGEWLIQELQADGLQLDYRHAELPDGALVISGAITVEVGDVGAARQRVRADKERRNETQPYRLASVGSTFANPEGDYAGRLIEEVGLKGESLGGARISNLHANFFINESDARSDDFLGLMALARHRVRERFGVELRPEVRFVGFDGDARMRELECELNDRDV